MNAARAELVAFNDAVATLGAAAIGVMGLVLALNARDAGMAMHGVVFALAGIAAVMAILGRAFKEDAATGLYYDGPIKVATAASVIWGIVGPA